MPSWQKTVVQAYLKNKAVSLPPSSYYSSKNRAYPDVSAMGHNFVVYVNGQSEAVGGTSAASPSFAGLVGLLNSESLAKNGKPLGFLNPLLYTMAKAKPATFIDVTTGSNACTEDGCASSCEGFNAAKGWDPVTGLGVPQYSQMLAYIKSQ
jgi:tripeptidyl-peptidase-1